MTRYLISSLFVIGTLMPLDASAGKLGKTAKRVDRGSGSGSSHDRGSYDDDDNDDGIFSVICALLDLFVNHADVADEEEENDLQIQSTRTLLPRPYYRGYAGYKISEKTVSSRDTGQILSQHRRPAHGDLADGKSWAARLGTDYQYDWANVHLSTAHARLESSFGLGVSARWTGFFEPVVGGVDTLSLLEGGVFWDMIPAPQVKLELGASLLGMMYADESYLGGTAGLRIDIFPHKPLVVSGEIYLGGLHQSLYLRGRGTLGVVFGPAEIFVGYDGQRFGAHDAVVYHGPVIGLRLWL